MQSLFRRCKRLTCNHNYLFNFCCTVCALICISSSARESGKQFWETRWWQWHVKSLLFSLQTFAKANKSHTRKWREKKNVAVRKRKIITKTKGNNLKYLKVHQWMHKSMRMQLTMKISLCTQTPSKVEQIKSEYYRWWLLSGCCAVFHFS